MNNELTDSDIFFGCLFLYCLGGIIGFSLALQRSDYTWLGILSNAVGLAVTFLLAYMHFIGILK